MCTNVKFCISNGFQYILKYIFGKNHFRHLLLGKLYCIFAQNSHTLNFWTYVFRSLCKGLSLENSDIWLLSEKVSVACNF